MRFERLAGAALATVVVGMVVAGCASDAAAAEDVPTNRGWGTSAPTWDDGADTALAPR